MGEGNLSNTPKYDTTHLDTEAGERGVKAEAAVRSVATIANFIGMFWDLGGLGICRGI